MLPLAIPGIVTGIILTSGRIFGEAAALLFTAGVATPFNYNYLNFNLADPRSPWSPFHPATTLSVYIWKLKSEGLGQFADQVADASSRGADHHRADLQRQRASLGRCCSAGRPVPADAVRPTQHDRRPHDRSPIRRRPSRPSATRRPRSARADPSVEPPPLAPRDIGSRDLSSHAVKFTVADLSVYLRRASARSATSTLDVRANRR